MTSKPRNTSGYTGGVAQAMWCLNGTAGAGGGVALLMRRVHVAAV